MTDAATKAIRILNAHRIALVIIFGTSALVGVSALLLSSLGLFEVKAEVDAGLAGQTTFLIGAISLLLLRKNHLNDEKQSIIETLKRLRTKEAAAADPDATGAAQTRAAGLAELALQAAAIKAQIERLGRPGAAVVGTSYVFALLGLLGTVLPFAMTGTKSGQSTASQEPSAGSFLAFSAIAAACVSSSYGLLGRRSATESDFIASVQLLATGLKALSIRHDALGAED